MEIATKSGRTVCVLMHEAPKLLATANHTLINCVDNVIPDYHTTSWVDFIHHTTFKAHTQDPTQSYALLWHNWQKKRQARECEIVCIMH